MVSSVDRSEIAFFDLETTVRTRPGQGIAILEFGAILVCPRKLVELESYDTLVRPHDLSLISTLFDRANGITADAVVSAPAFSDIADKVYDILHGRKWAGYNILRFDCARLREAYAQINRPPPEPKGIIDSYVLLTQRFGRRAGDMKMASLAAYFRLGQQTHRSLADVRMNLEVLKYCATVLFLESSLPEPNATTRNSSNAKAALEGTGSNNSPPSSNGDIENQMSPPSNHRAVERNHPIFSLATPGAGEHVPNPVESGSARPDPLDMGPLVEKMERETLQTNEAMEESSRATASDAFSEYTEFVDLNEVSLSSITVADVPVFRGSQRIQVLHRDVPLQIRCDGMRVRFGLSTKFVDDAGRPRLSFTVDASPNLCGILDACNNIAKRFMDSGSNSEWRPIVSRKPGFYNLPTIRLNIPTVAEGDTARWTTEIYQKESLSSSTQRFVFSTYDVAELEALFRPGSFVDAYFSLDPYNYQQNAGIRLVAKKLIVHSK